MITGMSMFLFLSNSVPVPRPGKNVGREHLFYAPASATLCLKTYPSLVVIYNPFVFVDSEHTCTCPFSTIVVENTEKILKNDRENERSVSEEGHPVYTRTRTHKTYMNHRSPRIYLYTTSVRDRVMTVSPESVVLFAFTVRRRSDNVFFLIFICLF